MSEESSFGQFLLAEKVSKTKYSPIVGDENGSESEASLGDEQKNSFKSRGNFWVVLPWVLTALFGSVNVILLAILCLTHGNGASISSDPSTFEKGFQTEFGKSVLEVT